MNGKECSTYDGSAVCVYGVLGCTGLAVLTVAVCVHDSTYVQLQLWCERAARSVKRCLENERWMWAQIVGDCW